jgi:hypothetical protein
MFFFTAAQRKYFIANEQDIEELSISNSDTGLFSHGMAQVDYKRNIH